MSRRTLRTPPGMRDFLPSEKRQREWVIGRIRAVFERFGYEPIETPALELLETLKGKLGEEGEQLLFKVLRRGTALEDLRLGRVSQVTVTDYDEVVDYALPYDLTVPFSRFLAMHPNLPRPFKRYQIQRVWRAEKPQRGRYREFYQCDVDVAGSESMLADAEIITVAIEALLELGFTDFRTRIGHRKILDGLVEWAGGAERFTDICVSIDKLEKIGLSGVREELARREVPQEVAARLLGQLTETGEASAQLTRLERTLADTRNGPAGIAEMRELLDALAAMGLPQDRYLFDLNLARGLDYYTGPVFETFVETPPIGSLTGGGRYDDLIGRFSGQPLAATGTSIGLERILDVMQEFDMLPTSRAVSEVLVTIFDDASRIPALRLAAELRRAGICTEFPLRRTKGLRQQIAYASSKQIPLLAILGPDELREDRVTLRAGPGNQRSVARADVAAEARRFLQELVRTPA
ncbi:MAG: histidine--tRNA ligase [Candidatus Eisenbacteria bacterium]|nr:histidine--tRNA ligase [Candidatus Eisenbacteria bacterium]